MLHTTWDAMDSVLLAALQDSERSLAALVEQSGFTRDVVAGLVDGYLSARYVTQALPGCDRYRLTLLGRARLLTLTASRKPVKTRKPTTTRKAA